MVDVGVVRWEGGRVFEADGCRAGGNAKNDDQVCPLGLRVYPP